MATSKSIFNSNLTSKSDIRFVIKFYIKDTNDEWVDFSDSGNNEGKDALLSAGNISHKAETKLGKFVTTIQNVTFKNEDGFFDSPFPDTLKTIEGNTAVFETSKYNKKPVLRGRECKITVISSVQNDVGGTSLAVPVSYIEETLGHFYVKKIIPSFNKRQIQLQLESKDFKLNKNQCDGIKNGYDWFEYRPASFLIEEILKSEYAVSGSIPSSYYIYKNPFLSVSDGTPTISILGRPPLWDGSAWRNEGKYTRALCHCNINSGGELLYLGCDDELWSFDSSTGTYTLIDDTTIIAVNAGFTIKHLEYDDDNDVLVIVAWIDEYWKTAFTDCVDDPGWECAIFTYDGTSITRRDSGTNYLASMQYVIRPALTIQQGSYFWYSEWGNDTGENALLTFPQHIQHPDITNNGRGIFSTYYDNSFDDGGIFGTLGNDDLDFIDGDDTFFYRNVGFTFHFADVGGSFGVTIDQGCCGKYWLGQSSCMAISNQNISGVKYLYHIQFYQSTSTNDLMKSGNPFSATDWYRITMRSLSGTATTYNITFPSTLRNHNPNCIIIPTTGNYGYIFCTEYRDDTTIGGCRGAAIDLTATTGIIGTPFSTSSGESGDDRYWSVIGGKFFSSNTGYTASDYALLHLFNRITGIYALAYIDLVDMATSNAVYSNSSILKTSQQPFLGFTMDTVEDSIIVYAMGEGRMYEVTDAGVISILNNFPALNDEQGLLAGLAVNQSHPAGEPEIYGVSSPTVQLDSYYSYQPGKYYLFRYHDSIADLIEYAQFDELTKFEAIVKLSQSQERISFFNRDGDFISIPRVFAAGTADYILGDFDSDSEVINNIDLDYGYDNVYNYIKTEIYSPIFNSPDLNALTLISRTDKNASGTNMDDIPFVDYSIEQRDNLKKKVYAYCIRGGSTTDGVSRWKFKTFETEIEAILAADAASSATTLTLNSVFGGANFENGVHVNDYATVVDPDTGESITRGISAVNSSTDQITIISSFGVALKRGVSITISKNFKIDSSYGKSEWSDEGVAYVTTAAAVNDLTIEVSNTAYTPVGSVVKFGEQDEEYKVVSISGNDLTLERLDGTSTNTITKIVPINSVVFSYYSPGAVAASDLDSSAVFEIGASKIFLKWFAGVGTLNLDYHNEFIPGDRLIIDCPGKTLEAESNSTIILHDSISSEIYDKNEFNLSNRFLHRYLAKEISKRLLVNYSYPRFKLTIEVPMIPYIDFVTNGALTKVDVVSPYIFPTSYGNKEQFTIEQIYHNLKTMVTKLVLSSVEFY